MAVRMTAAMCREAPKAAVAGMSTPWARLHQAAGEGGHVPGAFRVRGGVSQVGHYFRDKGLDIFGLQASRGRFQVLQDFKAGQVPGEGGVRVRRAAAPSQGQAVFEGLRP